LQVNNDTRFLEPFLPPSAVLMAWLCARLQRFAASGALLAAALAQFVLGYGYALGWSQKGSHQPWLLAAERDPTARAQLQAVVDATCDPGRPHDVNLVGVQHPRLNSMAANFYAVVAQSGRPVCRYAPLEDGTLKPPAVLLKLHKFVHRYYITVMPEKMPSPPDFLNLAAATAYAEVMRSEDWEHVQTIDDTFVVFRSRRF